MPTCPATLLRHLRRLASRPPADPDADAVLLDRFVRHRDEEAFAALVRRHGPMVLEVCRRVLADPGAADDAFQATFCVLARRAASVRPPGAVAAWLHGVASRVALKARAAGARHQMRETLTLNLDPPDRRPDPLAELTARELLAVVDEEVRRLPDVYRLPVLLCCLEGRTREEAARLLGWTAGAVKGRLERGRRRLHARLVRRGLTLAAALAAVEAARGPAPAGVPALLSGETVPAALAFAVSPGAARAAVSKKVVLLAEAGLKATHRGKVALAALLLGAGLVLAGTGVVAHQLRGTKQPEREQQQEPGTLPRGAADLVPRPPGQARTDRYGDPLPQGAVARLGTTRFLHGGPVRAVAFSADDSTIASGGDDNLVRLWDAATGQELRQLRGHQNSINAVAFSPDGRTLASGGVDQTIRLWEPATGKELRRLTGHQGAINSIAFSPDGRLLASGAGDRTIRFWEVEAGREVRQCTANPGRVCAVAFFPDGKRLASGSYDDGVRLWEVATGRPLSRLGPANEGVHSVAVSPDGTALTAGRETRAWLWDIGAGKLLHELTGESRELSCVTFSPDGRVLATGGIDGSLRLFDPADGKSLRRLGAFAGRNCGTLALAFSHDGRRLACGGLDHRVRLWEVDSGRLVHPFEGHPYEINAVAYSPDGRALVTASHDRTIRLWDVASGRERHRLDGYQGSSPGSVLFAPDGQAVLATAPDKAIRRWAVTTGKQVAEYGTGAQFPEALCVSHEGKLLAAGVRDQALRLWEVVSGKEVVALSQPDEFDVLSFSPDGRFLASQGVSKSRSDARANGLCWVLHVWGVADGKELDRFAGLRVPLWSPVAFSPDGKLLAAEDDGGDINVWEVATGQRRGRLAAQVKPRQSLCSLAFSPDGRTLAAGRSDGAVWLWEVMTGREVRRWRGHQARVFGLAFAPDGRTVASASEDATALLWDVTGSTARPMPVGSGEPAALWSELGDADAATAYRALWRLVAAGSDAVPFLEERLRSLGSGAGREERIARLIARLDDDRFESRQQAAEELGRLGPLCEPALRAALGRRPFPEARRRIERLLEDLEGRSWPPEVVHAVRAVQVLEQVGAPAARSVLKELAEGAPEAPLTQEAKASLDRLARQAASSP